MRPMNLLALAVLVVVGDGALRRASGRAATVDTDTMPMTLTVAAEDHLKHWPAPEAGSILSLTVEVGTTGTTLSNGTMTYRVQTVEGQLLCALTIPCAQGTGSFPTETCGDNTVDKGAHMDVIAINEGCLTRPTGTLTAVYSWRP